MIVHDGSRMKTMNFFFGSSVLDWLRSTYAHKSGFDQLAGAIRVRRVHYSVVLRPQQESVDTYSV
jgi:hypothetical protein